MAIPPQGLTEQQFADLSVKVRAEVARFVPVDVAVHGSRATGKANPDSDLDIAVLVTPLRFEELLLECFGIPNPGSAKEKTMHHARETGKIQAGEAKLRGLRKTLEASLSTEVDISIIRQGGPFDKGPYLPLA